MPANAELEELPRWVGVYAAEVARARGDGIRLRRILDGAKVPMVLVDDERKYVEVNATARLALGRSRSQLRQLRIDDLTPLAYWDAMEANWGRLMEGGLVAGGAGADRMEGGYLGVTYYAHANVLPGLHLVAFAPPGWPEHDHALGAEDGSPTLPKLTRRELEVLRLAAEGRSAPMIAEELGISSATVRTHFGHIYKKLGVADRAAAVAKAIRLSLIA